MRKQHLMALCAVLCGAYSWVDVAEWAEDNATVQALAEIGVDYVQGFAVARSQAPERILAARSAADFVSDPGLLHSRVLQAWPAPQPPSGMPPGWAAH